MTRDMTRETYHHGDLKGALLRDGLAMVAAGRLEAVSLRELARGLGVSASAVYRHYPDKQALVAAIAAEGFRQFAATLTGAVGTATVGAADPAGPQRLAAAGRAYLAFAGANTGLFRLMFGSGGPGRAAVEAADASNPAGQAFGLLMQCLETAPLAPEETLRQAAAEAWALVHGLACLHLDGLLRPEAGAAALTAYSRRRFSAGA